MPGAAGQISEAHKMPLPAGTATAVIMPSRPEARFAFNGYGRVPSGLRAAVRPRAPGRPWPALLRPACCLQRAPGRAASTCRSRTCRRSDARDQRQPGRKRRRTIARPARSTPRPRSALAALYAVAAQSNSILELDAGARGGAERPGAATPDDNAGAPEPHELYAETVYDSPGLKREVAKLTASQRAQPARLAERVPADDHRLAAASAQPGRPGGRHADHRLSRQRTPALAASARSPPRRCPRSWTAWATSTRRST